MPSLFDWSTTAASNVTVDGLNIAEGCPAANVNNGMRSIMALVRASFATGLQTFLDGTAALPVANGGTGGTTGGAARTGIGAAASGANTDITSLAAPALGAATATTATAGDNSTKVATTAFVTAAVLAALPAGVITIWSGSSGAIPTGWLLCNGTSGTPDLRDKFVVGAGSTYAVAATGGSANATLVSHSHTITITDPGHDHTANVTDPGHTHNLPGGTSSGGTIQTQLGVNSTASNGVSSSNTTGITVDNVSNTTGITASSNTQGSSATNANLPPYYALCYIMKA